jgi:hypothetical protein
MNHGVQKCQSGLLNNPTDNRSAITFRSFRSAKYPNVLFPMQVISSLDNLFYAAAQQRFFGYGARNIAKMVRKHA